MSAQMSMFPYVARLPPAQATRAGGAAGSPQRYSSPEVSALKEEIKWLRNQMQILTLLVGGNQAGAADLAKKGQQ